MNIGGRIRKAIERKYDKLKDFSKESGIPYRTLYEYFNDERMPGGEVLLKIQSNLDVSIDWLLTGKGEMCEHDYTHQKPMDITEIDRNLERLKPEQRKEIFLRTQEMIRLNELEERMDLYVDKSK